MEIPIVSLLVVVSLSLVITRIATVALMATGLSRELAQFQARSAFVGVGFTTEESERVLEHPVRRRIIMWLMLVGNAGFIAAVSSLIPLFVTSGESPVSFLTRMLLLLIGLALLWAVSVSKWVDRFLSKSTASALKRWARLDVWDYPYLLQLSSGYTVSELKVEPGDWVSGKNLAEVRLGDEGVQILGIRRSDGQYVGAPTGKTYLRRGDTLVVYGMVEHIAELDRRRADAAGDFAHEQRVQEQHHAIEQQEAEVRSGSREMEPAEESIGSGADAE